MSIIDKIISFFKHLFGIKDSTSVSYVPPVPSPNTSDWYITQASSTGPVVNNSFVFPQAATASNAWISYVERQPHQLASVGQTLTLDYTITGDNPVFNHASPGNIADGDSTIRLFLHQTGDDLSGQGASNYYRQFSTDNHVLQLGRYTLSVPLTSDHWTPVYPPNTDTGFASCLANLGAVGFVFGGGYFAGHGVAVSSGNATFTINSMVIS